MDNAYGIYLRPVDKAGAQTVTGLTTAWRLPQRGQRRNQMALRIYPPFGIARLRENAIGYARPS